VYELREVLDALKIDNARALLVDGVTVFQDSRNTDGDLPDLILALSEHASLFGESCNELRLCVEHQEAGIGLSLEASITSVHPSKAPSACLLVQGHVKDLDVTLLESAQDYRERIEDLISGGTKGTALRLQFATFIARLEAELSRRFPDTRFVVTTQARDLAELLSASVLPEVTRPQRSPSTPTDTAAPQRNFTITADQRISALVSGPPAYAVRLRKIEDTEKELIAKVLEAEQKANGSISVSAVRQLEQLNKLIAEHNKYYPVEANLPVDVSTGELMLMGEPWRPMRSLTIDALRRKALG
jgi:hypothetical protein